MMVCMPKLLPPLPPNPETGPFTNMRAVWGLPVLSSSSCGFNLLPRTAAEEQEFEDGARMAKELAELPVLDRERILSMLLAVGIVVMVIMPSKKRH